MKVLASAHTIQFNEGNSQESTFCQGLPMRFGSKHRIDTLGEFQEEGSLISVRMYDYEAYFTMFDSKLYSDIVGDASLLNLKSRATQNWQNVQGMSGEDSDTRKVLVFS